MRNVILAALIAGVTGCASSSNTNYYTLSENAGSPSSVTGASYSVAIGAVTLPEGIDRPQLVLRTGANQVAIAEFERWLGPPRDEIARAIADDLMRLLNVPVYTYPHNASVDADYKVRLDVQRFDSVLGEAANLEVLWQVLPKNGEPTNGRSAKRETTNGTDYDALVSAHKRALDAVSRDISAAIQSARGASK